MRLDSRHDRAARRVAIGRWTLERIAAEAGVSAVTLWTWRQDPDFRAREEEHRAALHAAVDKIGVADKQQRIAGMVERLQLLQQVIELRAERGITEVEADTGLTPGGLPHPQGKKGVPAEAATGLVVRQEKIGPFGTVVEWEVDTGTLAEMRALEKQVAQELGEWTEKAELKHDGTDNFLEALRFFGAGQAPRSGSE